MATTRAALKILANLPRVSLSNIKGTPPKRRKVLKRQRGLGARGSGRHGTLPRIGFAGGQTPFYLAIPKEPYYKAHSQRKEYVPLSLLQLQRMIDLGRVDISRPIDLTSMCNSKVLRIDRNFNQYGVHLVDEGADIFSSQICLEVQYADEMAIAAVERAGSIVTTRYYDPRSLDIIVDPEKFLWSGRPIPPCRTPTSDVLEYYTSAKARGYLVDDDELEHARKELAQKYGYQLPSITKQVQEMLKQRKHSLQIFYGLEPGWVVNMKDKCILKPTDRKLQEFYTTETML